ncbi:sporulation protein [Jeotgalibacillus sp. S-D1]|uniref:sporulation protein n=1 Tax=Jeotgalibacillus sp. S-D1 TaxID=2552189 RepID=UPI0010598274|nr:sporulation protein [Jeotgalibacillus sp. S-D1]TDL34810.1 sporulation protein [Jeotgalibacillus sp. S-D1]
MSLITKALATIGIGSLKIDTRLLRPSFRCGEDVEGVVVIKGGNVEQEVDTIYVSLLTNFIRESNGKLYQDLAVIDQIKLSEPFNILQNEIFELPFSFQIPLSTPITMNDTKVWVKTGADIKKAVDPKDIDSLTIKPSYFMTEILEMVLSLGFSLRTTQCIEAPARFQRKQRYIQQFVFDPQGEPFTNKLDDLEIVFIAESEEVYELLIEIDQKSAETGTASLEDGDDESIVRMRIRQDDACDFKAKLLQIIEQYT